MTKDRSRADLQSGQHELTAGQFADAEIEEASQRVGPLAEIPGLLRDFGLDPAEVAAAAGLDAVALDSPDSRVPYLATGRLLH
ncbi:MAG TPA: hypothetical protein VGR71_16515, partial [Nitrospira sp.]|nr:hypothetical protein [Nitrospira sp.]